MLISRRVKGRIIFTNLVFDTPQTMVCDGGGWTSRAVCCARARGTRGCRARQSCLLSVALGSWPHVQFTLMLTAPSVQVAEKLVSVGCVARARSMRPCTWRATSENPFPASWPSELCVVAWDTRVVVGARGLLTPGSLDDARTGEAGTMTTSVNKISLSDVTLRSCSWVKYYGTCSCR